MTLLKKSIFIIYLVLNISLFAQTKTNIEIINTLVDSSVYLISENVTDSIYSLDIATVTEYSALNNRTENAFVRTGISISKQNTINKISYSILHASVTYSDIFKNGMFGDYLLERKFVLDGEYKIENNLAILNADTFYYTVTDTIPYDKINFVENSSLPFTQNKKPTEPFFPSIVEPVIAITTVVLTVVLFFSVRSK